jgi:hypothetical protein
MTITAPEPISTAYFINPSHQYVCVYIYMYSLYSCQATAPLKRYRGNEYTSKNRRTVGRVIFYAVRVVSRNVAY